MDRVSCVPIVMVSQSSRRRVVAARRALGDRNEHWRVTLVLSQLVPDDLAVTVEAWEAHVRRRFAGEVVCGVHVDEFALATP